MHSILRLSIKIKMNLSELMAEQISWLNEIRQDLFISFRYIP